MTPSPDAHVHVSPVSVYVKVLGALLVLTALTVGVSTLGLPQPWSLILALIIAVAKGSIVAAYFMHLKFDDRMHTLVFLSALVFVGMFFAFTLTDIETRNSLVPQQDTFWREYEMSVVHKVQETNPPLPPAVPEPTPR